MKREDIYIIALWSILLGGLIVGVWFAKSLIDALGDVLVAVISGAFVLIGGIWTHALTQRREQRLEQQREMQRNYARLLQHIGEVIRDPNGGSDVFSTAHLESWVVGSEAVILATQKVLVAEDRCTRKYATEQLLACMRRDVGLTKVDESFKLDNVFRKRDEGHF